MPVARTPTSEDLMSLTSSLERRSAPILVDAGVRKPALDAGVERRTTAPIVDDAGVMEPTEES
ncbi:hypothetical protein N7G274_009726 [Stereocaulon virgatum]|uniref:Uncharacterized protein n=1 Tax=Stereocaulon virgatum TaxID=373712 RepID=A0ABR3ZXM2_9LECA